MSRVAKSPIDLPRGVEVKLTGKLVSVKGAKGNLEFRVHDFVRIEQEDGVLAVKPVKNAQEHWAMAGTVRALVSNMVAGVSQGFEKKLQLIGVGYRAQVKGKVLEMSLGFSHNVNYPIPDGIDIATPAPTEIVVSGCDKQRVGQTAAEIRSYRRPEPYKGKGIRYVDEYVVRKEAKKK